MAQTTLTSLEKRVAAIEKSLQQLLHSERQPSEWKDWRLAIAKVKRTDLAPDVDRAAREIREVDRRQVSS
jgi:hypothetical protein